MLFNQYVFLEFLVFVVAANLLLLRVPWAQKLLMIAASLVFFLSWGGASVALFLIVLAANYPVAHMIHRAKRRLRRALLIAVVLIDVSVLAYFKYFNFLVGQWLFNIPPAAAWAPLALSFYTFHLISYQTDIFSKKCKPGRPLDYVAYLSFFPHLIAGPIVRCGQLMPQFERPVTVSRLNWSGGMSAFATGFFLKCSADVIGPLINTAFTADGVVKLSAADAWAAALLFSCQIFGDFAGYSYMAIGMARLLGYELPDNFNAPYLAASFREFWQRWHITLSRWLRDYLYIGVLGGNRKGRWRAHVNTGVTMLLGGLWHGANWTFVAWGGVHGAALVLERMLGIHDARANRPVLLRTCWYVTVQIVVLVAWVIFRSPNFAIAGTFIERMCSIRSIGHLDTIPSPTLLLVIPVLGYHAARFAGAHLKLDHPALLGALTSLLLVAGIMLLEHPVTFIYFEF